MVNNKPKKRLSLISDIIIFLAIILIVIIAIAGSSLNELIGNQTEQVSSLIYEASSNIEDENKLYLLKLKRDYGITVLYGKDTKNYIKNIKATEQTNENIINNNLSIICSSLEKYPKEIFEKLRNEKYPLYIIIVDSFSDNNLALASRNNLNEYRIYISNTDKFERALHHEMYHVLEYYMVGQDTSVFKNWDKLNPKSFEYENDILNLDGKYVASQNAGKIDINPYFVTKYSKSSPKEDRAEIFAELMTINKREYYLEIGQNILNKVLNMLRAININIGNADFYFTKFIN